MNRKNLHEKFHSKTTVQYRSIPNNNFTYRNILSVINKYVKPKDKVLDIGCGAGTLSFYLANKGSFVYGIDISKKAIEETKKSAELMKLNNLTRFDVMDFPNNVPSGKFDVVILIEVIEHLEDDKLALRRIYNLLNKDGIAIISTPSINAPMHRLGLAKGFDRRVGHIRRYSLTQLERLCIEVGFTVVEKQMTEGIIRNFLFLNPIAGKSIRFIKSFISDAITLIDELSCKAFGESDLFIIVKK